MPKSRLLMVDDRIDLFGPQLTKACPSFEVITSDDPKRALDQFRFSEIRPDIIALDVNFHTIADRIASDFPGQDAELLGIHLLEMVRRMDASVPIVILTAFQNLQTAFGAGHHRANAFYTKEDAFAEGSVIETRLKAVMDSTRYSYDREQQQLAEEVAHEYRQLETTSPGTVAYWHFEEQKLIDTVQLIDVPKVNVLDVGVGDGRNPDVLFHEFGDKVCVTGVDFSGKMLDQCRTRHSQRFDDQRLQLERGAAERLAMPDNEYDLVIAGFGFLSYCTATEVLATIKRVAKPGAYILLGSYNHDALFYDIWSKDGLDDPAVPISGRIDRRLGVLHLGEREIRVRPATVHETERVLEQHGFVIDKLWTFPTLYASLGADLSERMATEAVDPASYHGFGSFSPRLYEQDVEHSANLDRLGHHKGYYTLVRCRPA